MKHLSLILSVALCALFVSIITSNGGGRMTPYAGMGRAIMAIIVGGISGLLLLVHALVVAVNLTKGHPLSAVYYASVALAAVPGVIVGVLALLKRL